MFNAEFTNEMKKIGGLMIMKSIITRTNDLFRDQSVCILQNIRRINMYPTKQVNGLSQFDTTPTAQINSGKRICGTTQKKGHENT